MSVHLLHSDAAGGACEATPILVPTRVQLSAEWHRWHADPFRAAAGRVTDPFGTPAAPSGTADTSGPAASSGRMPSPGRPFTTPASSVHTCLFLEAEVSHLSLRLSPAHAALIAALHARVRASFLPPPPLPQSTLPPTPRPPSSPPDATPSAAAAAAAHPAAAGDGGSPSPQPLPPQPSPRRLNREESEVNENELRHFAAKSAPGGRPQALQLAHSEAGGDRVWVAWRYALPRAVAAVSVSSLQPLPRSLCGARCELRWWDPVEEGWAVAASSTVAVGTGAWVLSLPAPQARLGRAPAV